MQILSQYKEYIRRNLTNLGLFQLTTILQIGMTSALLATLVLMGIDFHADLIFSIQVNPINRALLLQRD